MHGDLTKPSVFFPLSSKVTKRDEDSSLMQLKEEFRTYEALRREHDAQIVHIAMEAGLRISPEQWSSLLYGDLVHKSHMQSIIDKVRERERDRESERGAASSRNGSECLLDGSAQEQPVAWFYFK